MSRIHEALKRAEQERAPQPHEPAIPPPALPSVKQPSILSGSAAEVPEPWTGTGSEAAVRAHADQFLRFDDIWNACTAATWTVNSAVSVFAGPAGSAGAEQFRTLRSRLYQLRDRMPLKTILVTSALASEGKTFVASNLAQALARQRGCKVLLIDGDLRSSGLHIGLGASSAPGLSDFLEGAVSDVAAIQKGLDDYLCFMPGGVKSEDPAELLTNGRFKLLLEKLAPVFDWVVIDSPPTLPVSDALTLADLCDGVICVVRAAYTDFESAQKSCQLVQQKGLLGVVLNCADNAPVYGGYDPQSHQMRRSDAMGVSSAVY